MNLVCKHCNKPFDPTKHRGRHPKFCSPKCRSLNWKKNNHVKANAHTAVYKHMPMPYAQVCEDCNWVLADVAHHEDYTKQLEIEWLCMECHTYRHKKAIA